MGSDNKYHYGVVMDAGSSGTRMYIYKWLKNQFARQGDHKLLKTIPKLESKKKWIKKIHPGVSTYGEKPSLVGDDYLKELLDHAQKHIPKESWSETPVFVLATAGMRLLPQYQQDTLLKNICSYIETKTSFLIPDCGVHVQVISGETEGLYGWIAANYLLGGYDEPVDHNHGNGHHTYGFLDMGGASAQIAFAPNSTEAAKHANDLKLVRLRTIDGAAQEHKVFVTTWLGFGVNEARKRYLKTLLESYDSDEVLDPCLPEGYTSVLDPRTILGTADTSPERHLLGTGAFDECLTRTYPLLEKDKPCLDEPCLINGQHVPAIDFNVNHFIGISEYWYTTHETLQLANTKDKLYDYKTYQTRVKEFCEQPWSKIQAHIKTLPDNKIDEDGARDLCFKSSWLINILHDGIGVPRVGLEESPSSLHNTTKSVIDDSKQKGYLDPFQAVDKIGSAEVSWTMGKMALYASASIPPAGFEETDSYPVGIGSNIPGTPIPPDFEFPGGGRLQHPTTGNTPVSPDTQTITDKFSSPLLKSDSSHRVPGFVLLLVIVVIALFYLCGRGRRVRFFHKYLPNSPAGIGLGKKPHGTPQGRISTIISRIIHRPRSSIEHDRNLEEGASMRLYNPADFELSDVNDSDNDSVVLTMSNGKSRPGYISPPTKRTKKSSKSKIPGSQNPVFAQAGHLKPEALDRQGLVIRTESRERLDIGGRKSRNGSPTRLRSVDS